MKTRLRFPLRFSTFVTKSYLDTILSKLQEVAYVSGYQILTKACQQLTNL